MRKPRGRRERRWGEIALPLPLKGKPVPPPRVPYQITAISASEKEIVHEDYKEVSSGGGA